jgi:hypothetical protein
MRSHDAREGDLIAACGGGNQAIQVTWRRSSSV